MNIQDIHLKAMRTGTISTMQILQAEGDADLVAAKVLEFVAMPGFGKQIHLYLLTDSHSGLLAEVRSEVVDALARKGYQGMQFVAVMARAGHTYALELLETQIVKYNAIERLHLRAVAKDNAKTEIAWHEAIAAHPEGFEIDLYGEQATRSYDDTLIPLQTVLGVSSLQPLHTGIKPIPPRKNGEYRVWVFVGCYTVSIARA